VISFGMMIALQCFSLSCFLRSIVRSSHVKGLLIGRNLSEMNGWSITLNCTYCPNDLTLPFYFKRKIFLKSSPFHLIKVSPPFRNQSFPSQQCLVWQQPSHHNSPITTRHVDRS